MVLYFSATGNTEFIAKEIAKGLDDECVNLLERIRNNDNSELHSDKPFIICAPVYVCEMPRFMAKYLKKQTFTGSKDVYFIFTSGGYCGISGVLAKSMMKKKKMNYKGHAEFKMPRNYIINDSYPLLSAEECEERILDSYAKVANTVQTIQNGEKLKSRYVFLFESIITIPFNPVWSKLKYQTKDFYTTDKCVGCNKCVNLCPLNNIEVTEKAAKWGTECSHCMACIANCPVEAIEYGTISQDKERYHFRRHKHVLESVED